MASKKKVNHNSFQSRLSSLQNEAQKQIRVGLDRTIELLPAEPRKAVKRLSADVDKASRDLRKRAERAVNDARKQAERFAADFQKSIEEIVSPVTERLSVATRSDLEALRRRVDHLERRIESHTPSQTSAH
ncbi:MAG TPA: phasin family protein [Terriglobales bacterium]|nr:phasin family protein [Terriglobales bacterium]